MKRKKPTLPHNRAISGDLRHSSADFICPNCKQHDSNQVKITALKVRMHHIMIADPETGERKITQQIDTQTGIYVDAKCFCGHEFKTKNQTLLIRAIGC
jgi:hypothetical protein